MAIKKMTNHRFVGIMQRNRIKEEKQDQRAAIEVIFVLDKHCDENITDKEFGIKVLKIMRTSFERQIMDN